VRLPRPRVPFRRERDPNKVGAWDQWKVLPEVFPYLKAYSKGLTVIVVLTVASAVVGLAEPWPLALVIDNVITGSSPPSLLQPLFGKNPDPYRLLVFIVGFGFLISVLSQGVRVVNEYASAKVEQNIILDLRSKMFDHVTHLSVSFHDERHTGMLMSLINIQAASIGNIVMAFPPLAESFLMLIGMLVIALLIDWQVTLVSLVCVPFIYWAIGLYGTRIVPRIQRVQSLEMRSLSIVFEAMSMLRVIVSFGRQKLEHYRMTTQGRTAVDARVRLTVHQTMFSLGVATAIALGTAIVLGFGAYHVLEGYITLGELTVLIFYISAVYQPLESISATIGGLHQNFVFLNAAMAIMAEEPEVTEKPDAIDIGRCAGAIEFDDVSFSYKGRQGTIRNLSFKCEGGTRVAVVGPTGAGKTTLMNLLVRFYDPAEGAIRIDGHDLKDLTFSSLRGQFSLVMQNPMLFSGSIADNIRYGRLDATMDQIVSAAKAANCHEFVSAFPAGYETELGEGGAQLSGGERQRICVARAVIRDAPILILDEPTSSIDSKTEAVILDALDVLMRGRTSFMIAHRLSTIRDADLILVLNHGELVEQGTHEELLAQEGLYFQLYEAQTGRAARIEAEYAQATLAAGDSERGASDIIAEVATAEALAAYEARAAGNPPQQEAPAPSAPQAPRTPLLHGLQLPQGPQGPQPADQASPEQADVTERVIETLTDAVRQRIREALATGDGKAAAAARQEHSKLHPGTAPNSAEGNGADDQEGLGNDAPAPSRIPTGDDPTV
jgi:ATP-binding cassette, subfamily B, bacterial